MDVDEAHRDALFNLPPDKKWQLYCSKIQVISQTWYLSFFNNKLSDGFNVFNFVFYKYCKRVNFQRVLFYLLSQWTENCEN